VVECGRMEIKWVDREREGGNDYQKGEIIKNVKELL